MKIRTKLLVGFGGVAAICGVIGTIGITSSETVFNLSEKSLDYALLESKLKAREIDHLKWVLKVEELFTKNEPALTVQTDDHKCALGKFLYSKDLEEIQSNDSGLGTLINSFKEPHADLHASAIDINKLWKQNHPGLESKLGSLLDGHRKWAATVLNALLTGQNADVQTDPTKCALGKFLIGATYKKLSRDWPDFKSIIEEIKPHHKRLHESVIEINGTSDKIKRKNIYQEKTAKQLSKVAGLFIKAMELEQNLVKAQRESTQVLYTKTIPAFNNIKSKIDEAIKYAGDKRKKLVEKQSDAHDFQFISTWISIVIGVVVSLIFGTVLSMKISASLKNVVDFIAKVSKGDLSEQLPMGTAVNCSQFKKCGKSDCPSFGKEAYCWIESGSFSNNPSCPKAVKGEDCRECILYKKNVHDEFEEMGSAVNAFIFELKNKAEAAKAIAGGDLTQEITVASEKDDLGNALDNMISGLSRLVEEITEAAIQIDSGSSQVSSASQYLSQGATEQAASLEEISSAMTQIGSQTKHSSKNAAQANQLATTVRDSAELGNERIKEMVGKMCQINDSSQEISKIIKVIDDIAFQTNLLALNAAVEAARAGRHGKGFAVVAEEVRSLAGRCAKAAHETTELIENSVDQAKSGTEVATRTAETFSEIVDGVAKVTDLVGEIASSSGDQNVGISETSQALQQIDSVTQQNTASSEETAAASEELAGQAHMLTQLLKHFKLKDKSIDLEQNSNDQMPRRLN